MNYKTKIIYSALIVFLIMTIGSLILSLEINFSKPLILILELLGFEIANNIYVANYSILEINNFCSGLYSILLFVSIIISPITELKFSKRIIVLLFGVGVLYVFNFVRLLSMLYLSNVCNCIDSIHIIGWFFMSAIVLLIWYYFTKESK